MANPNLSGDWTRIPETKEDSASIQTTPGQRLCIRARHRSADGNVSEWDYIEHDVAGKTELKEGPADILAAGAQGQISIRYEPPPIEDFDYIQIAVGLTEEPSEAVVAYEGRERQWISPQAYQPSSRYYVFLRGLDTSRNASAWTEPIAVEPATLTDSGATVLHDFASQPQAAQGADGNLHVITSSGVLSAKVAGAWWNTRINVHAAGAAVYHIANSSRIVPSGATPFTGILGIPIGPEIPPGSTAQGDDGRTWNWSIPTQRFVLASDITLEDAGPDSSLDWQVNKPPPGCGRIYSVSTGPPVALANATEGVEGGARQAYDIAVTHEGAIYDYINGSWQARAIRLKPFGQDAIIRFRDDAPERWTWLDQEPVPAAGAFAYGETWRIVVCLSQGRDAAGNGLYGRTYIRNRRTVSWEFLTALCDESIPLPAAPRNPAIATADTAERIRITLSWQAPASRRRPTRYRYRLFAKAAFDNDGSIVTLMSGVTTLLTAGEVHDVDPPARFYLEVRAEYEAGNSNWARTEGLIGLSCADDPPPLAPALSFSGPALTLGTFNGIRGATTRGGLSTSIRFNWGYPGSGTRPAFWAWESGPNNLNPYIQPAEAGGERGDIQLTDPGGNSYTVYPDSYPGHSNPRSWSQSEGGPSLREVPGLVGRMSGRMISRCGSVFRWGERAIIDILRAETLTGFAWGFNRTLAINNLANVTPQGTAAGTFHFQYRVAGSNPSGAGIQAVQILIRGWIMDEHGRPEVSDSISQLPGTRPFNVTVRADRADGPLARSISSLAPIHSGSGAKEITLTTGGTGTDRILVVSGIPTDYDGFFSISMRYRDAANSGVSLPASSYGNWSSIRFQQRGTVRPPPPPTIGLVLNVRGNESALSSTNWEFQWNAPIADLTRNILPAVSYLWRVSGPTNKQGEVLDETLSVTQLNIGQHTLYVRGVNGVTLGPETSYVFYVFDRDPVPVIRPPENLRQVPSGLPGVGLVQFDRPRTGNVEPTAYPWRVTGGPLGSPQPTGTASATSAGGVARVTGLVRGTYTLHVKSRGPDPRPGRGNIESAEVTQEFSIAGTVPLQPFPPRNLFIEEGASRTSWDSSWTPPPEQPRPTGYETRISGATTQAAQPTAALTETHSPLNAGAHMLHVRSVNATSQGTFKSNEVSYPFTVRAEGCNPVETLAQAEGAAWNARTITWGAPVGGMAATGYSWELLQGGRRIRNGTTALDTRQVQLFNLAEGSYTAVVRAVCPSGPSEARSVGWAAVCPTPEPPQRLSAVGTGLRTAQTWTMRWTAPPAESADPTGYTWTLAGPENRSGSLPVGSIEQVFTDLDDGLYRFSIQTEGDCDKTSTAVSVGFTVGASTTCDPPRLLQKRQGNIWSTWTVDWLPPLRGDAPVRYDWRLTGATTQTGTVEPRSDLAGQVTMDNLQPGDHVFLVKSVCALSPLSESGETSIGITVERGAPSAPRNVQIEVVRTTITFEGDSNPCPDDNPSRVASWDAPATGQAPSNYDWELTGAATMSGTTAAGTRRVPLGILAPGDYNFRVRARSGGLQGEWAGKEHTVPALPLDPPRMGTPSGAASSTPGTEDWIAPFNAPTCGARPDGYSWRLRESGQTQDFRTGTVSAAGLVTLNGLSLDKTYALFVKSTLGSRESAEVSVPIETGIVSRIFPPHTLASRDLTTQGSVRFTWEPPDQGLIPLRYRWQITNPDGTTATDTTSSLRHTFTGLAPGLYTLAVRAERNADFSDYASIQHVVGTPVNPPTNLRVRGQQSGLVGQLSRFTWEAEWDPPASGGRAPTGYTWRLVGPTARNGTTTASDRRPSLGVLANGSYTFYVRADAGAFRSVEVSKTITVRDAVTIQSPRNLQVTEVETSIPSGGARRNQRASWDPPQLPAGHPAITSYQWRYSGTATGSGQLPASTSPLRVSMGDLAEGSYTFHVLSVTADGNSDEVSRTFTVGKQGVEPPVDLRETHTETGGSWTWEMLWRAPLSGKPQTKFGWRLTGPENSPTEQPSTIRNGETPADVLEAEFTGLDDGGYVFRLRTIAGQDESDEVTLQFRQPPTESISPPIGLRVTTGTDARWNTAQANWDAPTEGESPESYEWNWTGPNGTSGNGTGASTRVDMNALEAGDHVFQVRGTKPQRNPSEFASAEFTITRPNPGPPTGIKCDPGGSRTEKTVSWTAPAGTITPATGYSWTAGQQSGTTTGTSITLTLPSGSTTVTVKSTNGDLESSEVSVECVVEDPVVRPPRNVKATESTTNRFNWITDWDPPQQGDGEAPTGYNWELSGGKTDSGTVSALVNQVSLTGLDPGSYSFQVQTVAGDETSDFVAVSFEVADDPVNPPDAVAADTSGTERPLDVPVTITPPSEGKTPTGYEWRLSGSSTVAATAVTGTTFTIPALAEGSYTVHVRTVAGTAKSTEETSQQFDIGPGVALPSQPQGLTHSLSIDGTQVTYTWAAPAEGEPFTGVRWRQTGGAQKQGRLPATATSHQESNLTVGTQYTFAVFYVNAAGDGQESTVTFTAERTPQPPGPPLSVEADFERLSDGVVQVNAFWSEPDEGDPPTHYLASIDGGTHDQPTNTTSRRATFTGVAAGTRTVSVVAVNDAGSSSATTATVEIADQGPPNAVRNLTAEFHGRAATFGPGSQILTQWDAPLEDDDHAAAVNYRLIFRNIRRSGTDHDTAETTLTRHLHTEVDILFARLSDVTVTVTPVDAMGREGTQNTVNISVVQTGDGPPGPVRQLRAIYRGGTLTITWRPPLVEFGKPAAESYVYGYSGIFGQETTSTDIVIFNVTPGDTVQVAVQAKNRFGTGPPVTRTFIAQTAPERPGEGP